MSTRVHRRSSRNWSLAVALVWLGILACCGPGALVSHGGPAKDHVSFVDGLRGRDFMVEIEGNVQQRFLKADGTVLRISGGTLTKAAELQSFHYANDRDAETDARRIRPDGQPEGMDISWIAPPHWFLSGRVLVIYVGTDAAALDLLSELLGPQFAGA